jgi:hypothetical protein
VKRVWKKVSQCIIGVSFAAVRCLVVEKRVSVTLVFGYPFVHLRRAIWWAGANMKLGVRFPTDDTLIVTRT